eukprot:Skav215960  [mRNA]  locus=scaffold226:1081476:1088220:+ [translate_table: standard]
MTISNAYQILSPTSGIATAQPQAQYTSLLEDVFEEIELGYLPKEWEEHYYSPLIRVPLFTATSTSKPGPGTVTRMYLAEEEDHGRHEAGDYWYVPWLVALHGHGTIRTASLLTRMCATLALRCSKVYGTSSIHVANATVPEQHFLKEPGEWIRAPESRRAIAHVPCHGYPTGDHGMPGKVIYPLLSLFSQLSGVAALFCWAFFKSPLLGRALVMEFRKIIDLSQDDGETSQQPVAARRSPGRGRGRGPREGNLAAVVKLRRQHAVVKAVELEEPPLLDLEEREEELDAKR